MKIFLSARRLIKRVSYQEFDHMIFRQNFMVPGHWLSPKKVVILWVRALTVRENAFGCCCCCCWQSHGLLICNSWFFFKLNNTHQSETLHSNVTLFRLLQYSKSFANVLLVSAVDGCGGGAIIIEHPLYIYIYIYIHTYIHTHTPVTYNAGAAAVTRPWGQLHVMCSDTLFKDILEGRIKEKTEWHTMT